MRVHHRRRRESAHVRFSAGVRPVMGGRPAFASRPPQRLGSHRPSDVAPRQGSFHQRRGPIHDQVGDRGPARIRLRERRRPNPYPPAQAMPVVPVQGRRSSCQSRVTPKGTLPPLWLDRRVVAPPETARSACLQRRDDGPGRPSTGRRDSRFPEVVRRAASPLPPTPSRPSAVALARNDQVSGSRKLLALGEGRSLHTAESG